MPPFFNPEVSPPVPDSQPGPMMSLLLEVTANALANSVPPPTPLEDRDGVTFAGATANIV